MDTEAYESETVTCIYCGTTVLAQDADETEPYCSSACAAAAQREDREERISA